MVKTRTIYRAKYKEYNFDRYAIRIRLDSCLHDDVEDFMTKRNASLNYLVKKLLNDNFIHSRYTDPEYPA